LNTDCCCVDGTFYTLISYLWHTTGCTILRLHNYFLKISEVWHTFSRQPHSVLCVQQNLWHGQFVPIICQIYNLWTFYGWYNCHVTIWRCTSTDSLGSTWARLKKNW
jgi:hypothetical protein